MWVLVGLQRGGTFPESFLNLLEMFQLFATLGVSRLC